MVWLYLLSQAQKQKEQQETVSKAHGVPEVPKLSSKDDFYFGFSGTESGMKTNFIQFGFIQFCCSIWNKPLRPSCCFST